MEDQVHCEGGDQEHDSCVATLGYCPYCQPAKFYPGEPVPTSLIEA